MHLTITVQSSGAQRLFDHLVFNIEELSFVFDSDSFVHIFQNHCSTRINKNCHFSKLDTVFLCN